ncbi:hypothetical protein [uncultured Roseovarius sp.]|uniref:hypothetical protein n=1 Tax=uncultured Roseovarius sp. TaxID=293344 RepID=UPI0026395D45|nr:hypothetical protein [uncultured Roseovarius sp.]
MARTCSQATGRGVNPDKADNWAAFVYEDNAINPLFLYDAYDCNRMIDGFFTTIRLSLV